MAAHFANVDGHTSSLLKVTFTGELPCMFLTQSPLSNLPQTIPVLECGLFK